MAGIFGSKTLFSAVTGQVVVNGEAVAGAEVEQKAQDSSGDPVVRTTKTGPDGRFQFDEITVSKGLLGFLPSEVVVQQEITITHEGKAVTGWQYTKRDGAPGSESAGKEFSLVCDVSNEADITDNYYGVCRLLEK